MAVATLNRDYAVRILGIGALMIGMCVWSLYDGAVAWPRHNRSLEQVRAVLLATNLTAEAWVARGEAETSPLESIFRERGLASPPKLIKKVSELKASPSAPDRDAIYAMQVKRLRQLFEGSVYTPHDLQAQFVQAAITLGLGLLALISLGLKARKQYCADALGLHGSGFGEQTVPYGEIAAIQWGQWEEKGIVVLSFKSGARCRLDGWHFSGMPGVVDEILKQRPDLGPKKAS